MPLLAFVDSMCTLFINNYQLSILTVRGALHHLKISMLSYSVCCVIHYGDTVEQMRPSVVIIQSVFDFRLIKCTQIVTLSYTVHNINYI